MENIFIRFGLKLYRQIVGIPTCPLEAVAFRDSKKKIFSETGDSEFKIIQ